MNYNKIKKFWIDNIKEKQKRWGVKDEKFSVPNWENAVNSANNFKELHELGVKLRKEVAEKGSVWKMKTVAKRKGLMSLAKENWDELMKIVLEEFAWKEGELDQQKNNYDVLKTTSDTYENSIKEFQNKIKVIVGNDLTNWESKIVKAGSSDKDITDLQKKVSDLTNEKDNLDKELKQKQQQILDHKCDTPNSNELNQLKDDLKKANEEKEELERKLNNPNPNIPDIPDEEDKDLGVEELRTKLSERNKIIGQLKARLEKVEKNNSNTTQNPKKTGNEVAWGIAGSLLTAVVMIVLFVLLLKKPKKKKKIN